MHSAANRIVRLRLSAGNRIEVFARVLCQEPDSLFAELAQRQYIIDCAHRDGRLVRLLVNCLRYCFDEDGHATRKFVPPEEFNEWRQLIAEAKYWRLGMVEKLIQEVNGVANTIVIGYHGTLALGRGAFTSDVNFRKIDRILVSGKARHAN
uniref:Glycosidase n=1 Tax=Globodera pallida TaxID=36090 RepID=A0A183CNP6_GLOPA